MKPVGAMVTIRMGKGWAKSIGFTEPVTLQF